ncbi:TDT family transporter [Macrococcus sp. DPC7161]|uniref:TDT family transporter n=1 Tax=Macrococcus sp. DPC7161 TaxID=2507060 RepID=UPI00100BB1AC|nr:TDT family transporter [Macrococcus sp. DPC7161]RXK17887.1 TDT family transporter [Macrococcus sp. DPC7161]
MNKLNVIPVPMSGLMLALFSCGIFLKTHQLPYYNLFIGIAVGIEILLIAKYIFAHDNFYEQLDNPVVLSVSPTFSMSIMMSAVLLHDFMPVVAAIIWLIAIIFHTYLSILFIKRHALKRITMNDLFPSWFIPFVGFGVITTTSPIFNQWLLGQWMLWLSVIGYLVLLPFILYKILIKKDLKDMMKPLITILSTPGSLCLAGYLAVIDHKNQLFVILFYVLSQTCYWIAVIHLPKLLRLPFYPSYSAFTFPLVISATVSLSVYQMQLFPDFIQSIMWIGILFKFILCFTMVIYVLCRYIYFLYKQINHARITLIK